MKKDKFLRTRVMASEYDQIEKAATEAGLTRSEYLRRASLNQKISKISIDTEPLTKISIELSRQGNNLNQIARILTQRGFGEADLPWITGAAKEGSATITAISELLNKIRSTF